MPCTQSSRHHLVLDQGDQRHKFDGDINYIKVVIMTELFYNCEEMHANFDCLLYEMLFSRIDYKAKLFIWTFLVINAFRVFSKLVTWHEMGKINAIDKLFVGLHREYNTNLALSNVKSFAHCKAYEKVARTRYSNKMISSIYCVWCWPSVNPLWPYDSSSMRVWYDLWPGAKLEC